MEKEVVEVPVVSEMIRKVGVPLSPVVRANGFVFVSGLPGIDLATSKVVDGGIEEQAEASLAAVKHALEAAGSSLEKVVKATVYVSNAAHFSKVNRVYARYFPEKPPGTHLRGRGLLAHGVRHQDRVRRPGLSGAPRRRKANDDRSFGRERSGESRDVPPRGPAVTERHGGRHLLRAGDNRTPSNATSRSSN